MNFLGRKSSSTRIVLTRKLTDHGAGLRLRYGRWAKTTTLEKPRILCRHRDHQGRQCPLDASENREYCKFHLPD